VTEVVAMAVVDFGAMKEMFVLMLTNAVAIHCLHGC